ncbi:hypothetical protein [Massilia consociata]|uniref:Uncharacterized protein n=1 Tax=Massilia consociata TaxID=760117 RepID=A0ABV6FGK6_9BURK
MADRDGIDGTGTGAPGRLAREIARERHERALHDEVRAHLSLSDDSRTKDARERDDTSNLRRGPGR